MALEVVNGLVMFRYDLGDGPGVITNDKNVSDGKWHEVIAERLVRGSSSQESSVSLSYITIPRIGTFVWRNLMFLSEIRCKIIIQSGY